MAPTIAAPAFDRLEVELRNRETNLDVTVRATGLALLMEPVARDGRMDAGREQLWPENHAGPA